MGAKPTVYLASPLGFAQSTAAFMAEVVRAVSHHVSILNPWDDQRFTDEMMALTTEDRFERRRRRLAEINYELGRTNQESIDVASGLVAILDGVDVDSGTAAEIGYAFGRGKRIYGLRTDFRLAGDNHGAIVNLQVEYFIVASGGRVVTTLADLADLVADYAAENH
jgi:nucleoside 2-deoxyribosyltransferase